ncbi:hypothetical protein [Alkalicoccus chagannorensis]|uniref:hypothetical protein n=1 Tax=Alkalicoccus chagannorensis TaxID=427072 RepID=UPI0004185AB6|nr:hypothetical protein [Alkalicoccus chagannorensis]
MTIKSLDSILYQSHNSFTENDLKVYFKECNLDQELVKFFAMDNKLEISLNLLPKIVKEKFLLDLLSDEIYNNFNRQGYKIKKHSIKVFLNTLDCMNYNKIFNPLNSYKNFIKKNLIYPNANGVGQFHEHEILFNYVENISECIDINCNSSLRIIKIMLFHYYYKKKNPFKDNSLLLERFILFSHLSTEMNILSALDLVKATYNNNNWNSKLTDGIDNDNKKLIDLIPNIGFLLQESNTYQKITLSELNSISKKLATITTNISLLELTEDSKAIMYMFAQEIIFNEYKVYYSVRDIHYETKLSKYIIKKNLEILLEKGLLNKVGKKPVYYFCSPNNTIKI